MKRHGATLEHAQPQRARAEFDSDSLSALRRVLALAHYASVGTAIASHSSMDCFLIFSSTRK